MLRKKHVIIGFLISTFLLLSACGQKGELYLPGQEDANLNFTQIDQIS